MRVQVYGAGVVLRDLDRIKRQAYTEELALQVAAYVRTVILGRTQSGRDYQGRPFKPYSPQYKLVREEAGRQTRHVDLNFSGRMLAAMQLRTTPQGARVYFASGAEAMKAYRHDTGDKAPKREFFRPASDDMPGVERIVTRHLDEVIRGLN